MNKISRVALALVLSQTIATAVLAVPIEKGAQIDDSLKGKSAMLDTMAKLIRANGYTCNSISGAVPFAFSRGYSVYCNQHNYSYDIADKGGNWVVTLN